MRWVLGLGVAAALGAASLSWGHGSNPAGPIVASGESPEGVPWEIRVDRYRDQASFNFTLDPPGYEDAGYGMGFPLPIGPFLLRAVTGSDISPLPENDVSGVTDRRVRELVIRMTRGKPLSVSPTRAPERLLERERLKFLRGLRFFDGFYPSGRRPLVIKAYDADGDFLGKRRSWRGHFLMRAVRPSRS